MLVPDWKDWMYDCPPAFLHFEDKALKSWTTCLALASSKRVILDGLFRCIGLELEEHNVNDHGGQGARDCVG